MDTNPIEAIRQAAGWSLDDMAVATDMRYAAVREYVLGLRRDPGPMVAALTRLGIDTAGLIEAYIAWRTRRAQQLRDRLVQAGDRPSRCWDFAQPRPSRKPRLVKAIGRQLPDVPAAPPVASC
jgi:hypothetical protein